MKAAATTTTFILLLATTVFSSRTADGARFAANLGATKERRFFSAREGVGIEAPPGWTLSQHTGYPSVLVALIHAGGSRITVAVDRTPSKDATALVAENRAGLTAQGFAIDRTAPGPHGGVLLELRAARREQALRQLYIVRAVDGPRDRRQAVIVTLTAPAAQLAGASNAFDWALSRLVLEAPVRPDDGPDGGA